jgi:hypothetical protein
VRDESDVSLRSMAPNGSTPPHPAPPRMLSIIWERRFMLFSSFNRLAASAEAVTGGGAE